MMTDQEYEKVDAIDLTKKNSPINLEGGAEEAGAEVKGGVCYFNGLAYSSGTYICTAGQKMQCTTYPSPHWTNTGRC
jgi:hypothetical protein